MWWSQSCAFPNSPLYLSLSAPHLQKDSRSEIKNFDQTSREIKTEPTLPLTARLCFPSAVRNFNELSTWIEKVKNPSAAKSLVHIWAWFEPSIFWDPCFFLFNSGQKLLISNGLFKFARSCFADFLQFIPWSGHIMWLQCFWF